MGDPEAALLLSTALLGLAGGLTPACTDGTAGFTAADGAVVLPAALAAGACFCTAVAGLLLLLLAMLLVSVRCVGKTTPLMIELGVLLPLFLVVLVVLLLMPALLFAGIIALTPVAPLLLLLLLLLLLWGLSPVRPAAADIWGGTCCPVSSARVRGLLASFRRCARVVCIAVSRLGGQMRSIGL
jgi:hypothetical protein